MNSDITGENERGNHLLEIPISVSPPSWDFWRKIKLLLNKDLNLCWWLREGKPNRFKACFYTNKSDITLPSLVTNMMTYPRRNPSTPQNWCQGGDEHVSLFSSIAGKKIISRLPSISLCSYGWHHEHLAFNWAIHGLLANIKILLLLISHSFCRQVTYWEIMQLTAGEKRVVDMLILWNHWQKEKATTLTKYPLPVASFLSLGFFARKTWSMFGKAYRVN